MKVLHITNWYPNPKNSKEAIWIQRHVDALSHYCDNEVWHVRTVNRLSWSYSRSRQESLTQWEIGLPTNKWIIIEVITFLQLLWLGISNRKKISGADAINFHIAYPSLVFWNLLKPLYAKPILIIEHWSAYHFNFGVRKTLPRIRKIFRQNIPVMTVSQALANDIEKFSGTGGRFHIVPNVVDTTVFFPIFSASQSYFFMVSQWKEPKAPFVVMEAFLKIKEGTTFPYDLLIGGYGEQWSEMEEWVRRHDRNHAIRLLGSLDALTIADIMRNCVAFLHPSAYETFSVACAEALCCGAPVVASKVGGITEFVDQTNGILIKENTVQEWIQGLSYFISEIGAFDRKVLAMRAAERFSAKKVGASYYGVIRELIESYTNT